MTYAAGMSITPAPKAIRPKTAPAAEPRPRVRREDPEVRRQELLRATVTCLARLGPNGTTGREICRQAGVSHSLLRHYFGNPQTLLLEAYSQLCDGFIARLEADLAGEEDPWRAFDTLFRLHLSEEWAGSDVLGAWIAFWTLVRARGDFAEVRDAFSERLARLIGGIIARLPERKGGPTPANAASIIGGVMDGIWLEYGLSSNPMSREHAIELCNETARRLLGGTAA
jgi:TetR/AcrR family transcriptional repressor of bet genes